MDRRDILVQAVELDITATSWFNALCNDDAVSARMQHVELGA
jgi:hypothetical protein